MKLKLVKSVLLVFCLVFGFSACKKEDPKPLPETSGKLYPVSVTRSASYTSDVTRSEFTYNNANQITKEAVFKNGLPQGFNLFHYDAAGKLIKKTYHSETGQLKEQDLISYSAAGQPDKLLHGYVDTAGTFEPHHYRLHNFHADGRILSWSEFMPSDAPMGWRSYAYPSTEKVISQAYNNSGQHVNTSEITFDLKPHPFQHTAINLIVFAGNELRHEVKDLNNQVISSYSNAILYNQAGYPEKITQTHTSGVVKTEIYEYRAE